MYKHILLPTDGSDRSARAIKAGVQLAGILGARVTGLYVSEATYIHDVDNKQDPRAEAALAEISHAAQEVGVKCQCVTRIADTPRSGIVQAAEEKACDLIIMGTHGRSRVGKLLLGSSAAEVLAECDIPVLLYR